MTSAAIGSAGVVPEIRIHQRLMIARQYVDLNQQELARILGVTTSTVQRAEAGQTRPRRTTLMAWSMATGVNLHWLETGTAPHSESEGPLTGKKLPHLDSNQKPADYQSRGVIKRLIGLPRQAKPLGTFSGGGGRPHLTLVQGAAS